MIHWLSALLLVFAGEPVSEPASDPGPGTYAVKAAKVFTSADAGVINRGMVYVRDGKIVEVGRSATMQLPPGTRVIDLGDLWLAPGLHEPHCHVAGSLSDLNDTVYLTNPEVEALQVIEPENDLVRTGLAGGVTTALLIPGSGSNMGGFGMLVKMAGSTVDEVLIRAPGSLKVAQAGNPERYGWGVGRALMNWNTRDTLKKGLAWAREHKAGERDWELNWANFAGLEDRTVPVSVHTQIFQVVMQTILMQKAELGLDCFIDHGTFDGFKNAELAAQHGVPVMNGPRQFWFDRSRSKFFGCGAEWAKADGLILGYNTDSPVIPQEELSYQAAMGVRLGHEPIAALEGITSNAAIALKCEDISGSLVPGLDADFVAWTGFPLDPRSSVEKVWVRGKLVYDTDTEPRRF